MNQTSLSDSATHNHHNHGHVNLSKGRLLLVIFFNLAISVAEIIGGLLSGSLALVSDAIHNLSDTVSIVFSYLSLRISEKPKSKTKTYGYNRANILTAFVNAAALMGIAIYLVIQSITRFIRPSEVVGNVVIIVAVIGLFGNLFSILVLRKSAKKSMNIKSSYLHLLSDTLSSVAVIISGILIKILSVYWIDPVITVLINVFIFKSSFGVLKESVDILMQGTPITLDIEEISNSLLRIPSIKSSHHIHVWQLDEHNIILEGHVIIDDMLVSMTSMIYEAITEQLDKEFNIHHAVIQFESDTCSKESCVI